MSAFRNRRVDIRLICCSASIVLLAAVAFSGEPKLPPPRTSLPETASGRNASELSLMRPRVDPLVTREMTERPMFDPSRRPWVTRAAPVSRPVMTQTEPFQPPLQPSVVLYGIITEGHFRAALIRLGSSQNALIVHEGEVVDGWTVRAITLHRITLSNGASSWSTKLERHA